MPSRTPRKLTSAADLRALAHPLRMDLLEYLSLHGAHTATQLAEALGDSPSNCSWHLRKLAEHGYVEEVPDSPGRSRPWRVSGIGLSWDSGEEQDLDADVAAYQLSESLLTREVQRWRASRQAFRQEPTDWQKSQTFTQAVSWLTAEEAADLSRKLTDLLMTYGDRIEDPSLRPEGSRLVSLVGWVALRPDQPRTEDTATPVSEGDDA